jgi:hypothetical protein
MSPEFVLRQVCAHLACNHAFVFRLRDLFRMYVASA